MSKNPWDQRLGVWWIAEDHPDAMAIVESPDGSFTYGELTRRAHQLVHTFRALGVQPGDAIAIIAPNGVRLIETSLACLEAGWYVIPVNTYLTAAEIEAIVEHSGAAALVIHRQFASLLDEEAGRRVLARTQVIGVGGVDGLPDLDELREAQPVTLPEARTPGALFAYSSGTTGKPKGIRRALEGADPSQAANDAAVFGRAFDFRPFDGPHLVSTAMYHGGSFGYYMGALNVGHALVIMAKFDPERTLQLIEHHKIRSAYMVPTQFHRMLQLAEETRAKYDLSSLHSVVHSAAPCPRPVKEKMFAWWGPVIWETYGGMEGAATIAKPHRWLEKPGTVGRAVRGVRLSILDDDGNELPAGQTGNIFYETQAGFSYHGEDEMTANAHQGKMFTIGDVGYLDDDGYLFIQDRAKDMIITGGVNVYPAEVEGILAGHPAVGDVAVIGLPDDDWGESVLALVEVRSGYQAGDALADELLCYCRDNLAVYKCPRRIEFRENLPRTEAGKLYKRLIRDEYWKALGRRV